MRRGEAGRTDEYGRTLDDIRMTDGLLDNLQITADGDAHEYGHWRADDEGPEG